MANGSVVNARAAMHGNDAAPSFRDARSTATLGKSRALECLNASLDASGEPAKALASEVKKSEPTFSKMRSGVQAFGVDDFERLPRPVQVAWMKRYGKEIGVAVRELDSVEMADSLLEQLNELLRVVRLYAVRTKALKATLPMEPGEE